MTHLAAIIGSIAILAVAVGSIVHSLLGALEPPADDIDWENAS